MMDEYYSVLYNNIKSLLDDDVFRVPIVRPRQSHFPDFLNSKLNNYISYFENHISKRNTELVSSENGEKFWREEITLSTIKSISEALVKTIELYFEGKVFQATQYFNSIFQDEFMHHRIHQTELASRTILYRARKSENRRFSKKDLFHVPYELRNYITTKRYSVPGFPALYLGDSCYLCWEEFDQYNFKDMWFSKCMNITKLKVASIQRIEDFIEQLEKSKTDNFRGLVNYLTAFPLIISCSIKVSEPNSDFKPEYIIPQLLLEFVSNNNDIDGIMYLSTKVDYSKLSGMSAYNYVFPAKEINPNGYCSYLSYLFRLTNPTSMNLEEIINNFSKFDETKSDSRTIEFMEDIKSEYSKTLFGKMERNLRKKEVETI